MADLSTTELGLQVAESPKAPARPRMNSILVEAAKKNIEENKVREATEDLRNPGKALNPSEAPRQYEDMFKPDEVDPATGNLVSSTDQAKRMGEGKKVMTRLAQYAEKGYDKMPSTERQLLKNDLSDYLFNHQAFRASSQAQGFDLTDPSFRAQCEAASERLLKNSFMADTTRDKIADFLATSDLNYKALQQILDQQKELDQRVLKVKDEIGDDTKGLTKEVIDTEQEYESKYQRRRDPSDPNRVIYGTEIQEKAQKQSEITAKRVELDSYAQVFQLVQRKKDDIASGGSVGYTDPETGNPVTLTASDDYFGILNGWGQKISELNFEIQQAEDLIKIIDEEKDDFSSKLQEKRKQKDALEKELKEKEEDQRKLEKQKIEAQGGLTQQEEEVNQKLSGIVADAATDVWVSGKESVEATQEEAIVTGETQVYRDIQKKLYSDLYNDAKKEFRGAEFKTLIDNLKTAPLGQGVEGFGVVCLNNYYNSLPATSELRPIIDQMRRDPAKLAEFSSKITIDVLKLAAYKDPEILEKVFAPDEGLMRSLQGDVLPAIVEEALKSSELRALAEKQTGSKLTGEPEAIKKTLKDRFASMDKKKLLAALIALLGSLGIVVAAAMRTKTGAG